jgi:hypothetical protein
MKIARCLAVVFLAVPLSSGCGPSAVSKQDLVELAAGALVSSETALLDFGARDSREHLVSGWSEDETATDGMSFVWATGASSRLRLFIAEPRPLELSFRAWPFRFPGAPPQRLTLELNGGPLSELTLLDSPSEYRVPLPAELQLEGDNTLDITCAYRHSPRETLPGASDPRRLSVGWDWIRVEGAMVPPGSIANGDGLTLPYGARVTYLLDLPPGSRLELDAVRPWANEGASPYLAISSRTLSSREDRTVPGTSRGLELPLDSDGGLVALSLQARTGGGRIEGEGGLLVRRPVVVSKTPEVSTPLPRAVVRTSSWSSSTRFERTIWAPTAMGKRRARTSTPSPKTPRFSREPSPSPPGPSPRSRLS